MQYSWRRLNREHASALELGQDLGVMIAYDIRLKAAAQAYGLSVESPS